MGLIFLIFFLENKIICCLYVETPNFGLLISYPITLLNLFVPTGFFLGGVVSIYKIMPSAKGVILLLPD